MPFTDGALVNHSGTCWSYRVILCSSTDDVRIFNAVRGGVIQRDVAGVGELILFSLEEDLCR